MFECCPSYSVYVVSLDRFSLLACQHLRRCQWCQCPHANSERSVLMSTLIALSWLYTVYILNFQIKLYAFGIIASVD